MRSTSAAVSFFGAYSGLFHVLSAQITIRFTDAPPCQPLFRT
jgi:hypothetical protein